MITVAVFGLQTYKSYQNPEGNTHNQEEVAAGALENYGIKVSSDQAETLLNGVDSNNASDGKYGTVTNFAIEDTETVSITLIRHEKEWKLVTYTSDSTWVELDVKS